jgi:hypothetical protein
MQPWQVEVVENKLAGFRRASPLTIFEWGCGGSTVHFAKYLRKLCRDFVWISAETDTDWVDTVATETMGLPVVFTVYPYRTQREGWQRQDELKRLPMDEYVNAPLTVGPCFDIYLVDGRKRSRCLDVARGALYKGGLVILHDAEREYYHEAANRFAHVERVTCGEHQIWMMTNED